jgi:hypothetical protein
MRPTKPLTNVCVCIALLLGFTSLLVAYPLGSPNSGSELLATPQCPGGVPPPCDPPPPPVRRATPRPAASKPRPTPRPSPQRNEAPARPNSTPAASSTSTPTVSSSDTAPDPCSVGAKEELYDSFRLHFRTDADKAYNYAQNYLRCPTGQVTAAEQAIIDYLKKYSVLYETAVRRNRMIDLLYNKKKYPEAYTLGREILSNDPDNLEVLVHLGVNGYMVLPLKNPSLTSQALEYARRALQQISLGRSLNNLGAT